MPYATNNGIRIHYDIVGAGPPLVLHHGTAGSSAFWSGFGYVDALKASRTLVILDARGHGSSDKPYDPAAYDLASRVGDVTAVLDECGIARADYFGYSLGGWIGFGAAKYAPSRLRSLIVGAAHPYAESMRGWRNLFAPDPKVFLTGVEKLFGSTLPPMLKAAFAANDFSALLALTQDRDSIADVLESLSVPCLLFCGDADPRLPPVKTCAEALPHATFVLLAGCNHATAWARADLVLPHVQEFLAAVPTPV
jgi:pimeloyl-ACP methyl ester carboxylesterase